MHAVMNETSRNVYNSKFAKGRPSNATAAVSTKAMIKLLLT